MKRLPIFETILAALGPVPALVVALTVLTPQPAIADPAKATLTVTITDIKEHKGAIMLAVFDEAGYGADKQLAAGMIPVTGDAVSTTFDLSAGKYGIKLFQDVDGDGKMGTNPFGMPIEPYAFSNNAPAQFGPAKWAAAAFDVAAPATTHTIKLN